MVRVEIEYEGDLHCRAVHGPSGSVLATDAPVDNRGRGEAFSPTDLVGTALGTCMATLMGIAAQEHGWDIAGTRVTVDKAMVADPRRRIGRLAVVIRVPGEHDARARKVLEAAALTCPVHASLAPEVDKPVTFEWDGPATG